MNEIPTPPTSPDPKPFQANGARPASGCQKPLLIGCGTLALLLGIGAIIFVLKAKDVLAYAMGRLQAEVIASLPPEVSADERRRMEEGFATATERIRSGDLDPASLQLLQKELTTAAQSAASRKLTGDEVRQLQQALDAFNGVAGAPPGPHPPGD